MQFRRTLPGAGSTDFYLTDPENGGLSIEQQEYAADLIIAYRRKYPDLKINAVWDFGMEEADPVQSEKYGVFADNRDNAVYNAKMLTVSIEGIIREEMQIVPCAENMLSAGDLYFADVQAIRMLENTESLKRLLIHEIGHMLSEETGAVAHKKIRKLFGKCRDGFENIYEFCAECFMASELTDRIKLANEYRETLMSVM